MEDIRIIQLLKDNELEAMDLIIDTYLPQIEELAFQYGINPQEIANVVQESINFIYRKKDLIEEDTISNWVYIGTIKTLKGYKQQTTYENLSNYKKVYGYYLEHHEKIVLHYCVNQLHKKNKIPFILHYFHRKSIEDIAHLFNVSENKVKRNLEDAFSKLKKSYVKNTGTESRYEDLESLISATRFDFERLPRFTSDKQAILFHLKQLHSNQKWKKYIPIVIGVVGLLVFTVFSMTYLSKEREKQAIQEQNEQLEEENNKETKENNINDNELEPEITAYFEMAKEVLAEEFRIDTVDHLPMVTRLELLLQEIKPNNHNYYTKDDAKYYIDMMLTPPSIYERNIDPESRNEENSFSQMLYSISLFESNLQEYLIEILTKHQIPTSDYHAIIRSQELISAYDGPAELKEFIFILASQGYTLRYDSDDGTLHVKYDYEHLKNILTQLGFNEGYLAFIDIAPMLNNYYFVNDNWGDSPEILIALETLIEKYGAEYDEAFYSMLTIQIGQYLNAFLSGPDGIRPIQEEDRNSYYQFLENYPDSVFWDIIDSNVKLWETNNWEVNEIDYVDHFSVNLLFDERFKHIKWEDIKVIHSWPPLSKNSVSLYTKFKKSFDLNLLLDQTPFETVSLYDYVFRSGERDMFSSLIIGEGPVEWPITNNPPHAVMTEYTSDTTAIVYLADWEMENIVSLEMKKVDGVWRIIQ